MKKVIGGFLTTILLTVWFPSISTGQNSIDMPPSNLLTFRNTIEKSLVSFSCANESGIAFSGNWTTSEEDVNKGINSSFFTSGLNLGKCGKYDSTFEINYLNKNYTGKIWNGGQGYPDFGGFNSSLKVPRLSLWGSNAPDVGSWVTVVRSAPGFGFIWSESKVRLYNPETLIFAIDVLSPSIDKNALVFNNLGEFIGVVSTYATKQVDGFVTVHGAPLQCKLNKTQTTSSVTNCSVFAQDIWKSNSSASNPTTPSIDSKLLDAYNAAMDEKNILDQVITDCLSVYSEEAEYVNSFVERAGLLRDCSSFSESGDKLMSDIVMENEWPAPTPNGKTKQQTILFIEGITKSLEKLVQSAADQLATLYDTKPEVVKIVEKYNVLLDKHNSVMNIWPALVKINNLQTLKVRSKVLKNKNWISGYSAFLKEKSSSNVLISLDTGVEKAYSSGLRTFGLKVTKANSVLKPDLSLKVIKPVLKMLPSSICVDGSKILLPTNKKCSSTYELMNSKEYLNSLTTFSTDVGSYI